MAYGTLKATLVDDKGIAINGKVTAKKGSLVRSCSSAGGACTISSLDPGTWVVTAKTFNGSASSDPLNVVVPSGGWANVTMALYTHDLGTAVSPLGHTPSTAMQSQVFSIPQEQLQTPIEAPAVLPVPQRVSGIGAMTIGQWIEITEADAQELVEAHGGQQGDALDLVDPVASDMPMPTVPNMTSSKLFQAPDGWKIVLLTDQDELEYYFVVQGTQHKGLSLLHYGIIGAVGAGAGYLVLNRGMKAMRCPWAAIIGAGSTLLGAVVVNAAIKKAKG